MVTHWLFLGIVLLLAGQRLAELRLSRLHEKYLYSAGGREFAPFHYKLMVAMHVAWFIAMLGEVFWLGRPFHPGLALAALLLLAAGQALRYAAIRTLGWRWCVKVIPIPGAPLIESGIYKRIRHPNYLGIIFEIAAVPLLHSAYLTAFLFSLINAGMLAARIHVEEKALMEQQAARRQPPSIEDYHPVS
jgi:methyltransferase